MHAALRAEGRIASRGRVARLMRRHGIRALAGRRFKPCTTDSRHHLPVAPNLLRQDFSASVPNRTWLADITYIATNEGWLYLAAVLDLATRKIVGWAMRDHMRTELPLAALIMAAQRQRPPAGLIHHSDRGSQYAAEAYGRQLAALKAMPSSHRRYGEWTPAKIREEAKRIGPMLSLLVEKSIENRPHPEQGYRSCLGIIGLEKRFGAERLEAAALRALEIQARNYPSVKSILEKGSTRCPCRPPRSTSRSSTPTSGARATTTEGDENAETSHTRSAGPARPCRHGQGLCRPGR